MDAFEAIGKRYSYRGAYKNIQIPREDLKRILEAGIAAPSGCNTQTTSFIALDDPTLINSLFEVLRKKGFEGGNPNAGICVLTQKIPGYANVFFNVQDYAAAIENILVAVTACGYASCWIEGQITESAETQKQLAALLNVPDSCSVVAFLPIGVPEQETKRPAYKAFSERAWYNTYGNNG